MARPELNLSPECQALWEDACARWQQGELDPKELAVTLGVSLRTVYYRLQDAQQRIELRVLDENQDRHEARMREILAEPESPPDRDGPPEVDEGAFLVLTEDPCELIRPYRDYSRDKIHGEEAYRQRDFYLLPATPAIQAANPDNDPTSLDKVGGAVLVGGGAIRYNAAGAGRLRLPSPPLAGQRLRRNRLGTGNRAEPGGPTATPESDGRKGGTEAKDKDAEPPLWRVIGDDGSELRVRARKLREAKRAVKRLLGMAMAEPLPPGVRFCREG